MTRLIWIIVEINERLPVIHGGWDDSIHISEVDMVVIGDNPPLMDMKIPVPKDTDIKIAEAIIPYISDGLHAAVGYRRSARRHRRAYRRLGAQGSRLHTELASDAYYKIHKAGKLTNKYSPLTEEREQQGFFMARKSSING